MKKYIGEYQSDMRSGYYPYMSYEEWLYNIKGVDYDGNMEVDITLYYSYPYDDKEGSFLEKKMSLTVWASDEEDWEIRKSVDCKLKEEQITDFEDFEIDGWNWIEEE